MKCKICDDSANIVFEKINSYIEGDCFNVLECSDCKAQFINPMTNLQESYDKIYGKENTDSVYSFYYYLANGVKHISNPLKKLANFSAFFWVVENTLNNLNIKEGAKILEVGSGLGYLVHALRDAGYDATGLEYSPEATEYAIKNFGEYSVCGNVFEFSKNNQSKYDCIIATEVIEHIEDPVEFTKAITSMLVKGGTFILTTPNKDFEPTGTIWKTDYPPIHLWWYTEKSIENIASKLDLNCKINSFKEYKNKYLWHWHKADENYTPNKKPILDKNGNKIEKIVSKKEKLQKIIPAWLYVYMVIFYHKLKFLQKDDDQTDRIYILSASLTKK